MANDKPKRITSERNFWLKEQDSERLINLRLRLAKKGILTNFSEIVCASFLLCEKTPAESLVKEIENLRAERAKLRGVAA